MVVMLVISLPNLHVSDVTMHANYMPVIQRNP